MAILGYILITVAICVMLHVSLLFYVTDDYAKENIRLWKALSQSNEIIETQNQIIETMKERIKESDKLNNLLEYRNELEYRQKNNNRRK